MLLELNFAFHKYGAIPYTLAQANGSGSVASEVCDSNIEFLPITVSTFVHRWARLT